MGRTVLRFAMVLLAAALLILPAASTLLADDEPAGPDPVRVTDYQANFVLTADGTLVAKEILVTQFPAGRHGIARTWDVADPTDEHVRLDPEQIRATLDGRDVPVDLRWHQGRRRRVADIGDPDATVSPGAHTYTISYLVKGALSSPSVGSGRAQSVFRWDVVPEGWQLGIDRTTIRMTLPVASTLVRCAAGPDRAGGCAIEGAGTDSVVVSTGAVPPRAPVTVRIGLPIETPDRTTVPWPVRADRVLGRSAGLLAGILVITIALGAVTYGLERRFREQQPGPGAAATLARLAVGAAAILLVSIGIFLHPPVSMYLLPLAGIAIGGAGLLTPRSILVRRQP